ncbi:phosphotransferase [Halomonas piscis]|uniref:Phosphotransferase n=1 Tax=Halomonas piscis TaxID=3031727 RepID=A0ABY9Z189_9GAMM|nr:phosphotransferase [Halomonas piscis]WNK20896.1 phosphotransferase [Halomonas piscis]
MSSHRFTALKAWAARHYGLPPEQIRLAPAGGDASFRRYFRLLLPDGASRILMDAPPEQEDSTPFVSVARRLAAAGLPVPEVHAADLESGFLLLDDLGDTPLQALFTDDEAVMAQYHTALALLGELQNRVAPDELPAYDAALLGRELELFPEWCLGAWLGIDPPAEYAPLGEALVGQALAQPVVTVHRDFDAMNLMPHRDRVYMIDFQDAVAGPLSYDLVSMLRGRYWRFTRDDFTALVKRFYQQARADGRLSAATGAEAFVHQANAMAAQRSLKVLGIFCRLTLRDGKSGYLERLPRFVDHLEDSLAALPEHAAFARWVEGTLRPAVMTQLAAAEATP